MAGKDTGLDPVSPFTPQTCAWITLVFPGYSSNPPLLQELPLFPWLSTAPTIIVQINNTGRTSESNIQQESMA